MGWDQSSASPVTPLDWDSVAGRMSGSESRSPAQQSVVSDMDSGSVSGSPSISRVGSDVTDWITDEGISERASKWGNGVAEAVMKNARRLSSSFGGSALSSSSSWKYVSTGSELAPTSSEKVSRPPDRLESAISSIRLAFMVCDATDPEARILYASSGFHKLTGYTAEEAVGKACWFLLEDETDSDKINEIQSTLQRGESYTGTMISYRKDGTPFWNMLNLSPISDENGVVIKHFGMLTEVNGPPKKSRAKRRASAITDDIEAGRSRSILTSLVEDVAMSPVTMTDFSGPEHGFTLDDNDHFPVFRGSSRAEEAGLRTGDTGSRTEIETPDSSARITKARQQYSLSFGALTGRSARVLDRETGASQRHSNRYSLTISPRRSMEFRSRRSFALGSDSRRSMDFSASGKWSIEIGSKAWRRDNSHRRYSMSILENDPSMDSYLALMPPETREWYASMAAGSLTLELNADKEAGDAAGFTSRKSRPLIWFLAAERSAEFEEMDGPSDFGELQGTSAVVSGEVHNDERKIVSRRELAGLWRTLRWRIQRLKFTKSRNFSGMPHRSNALTKIYRSRHQWTDWMKAAMSQVASARQSVSYILSPSVDASR